MNLPAPADPHLQVLLIEDSPVTTEVVRAYLMHSTDDPMEVLTAESLDEGFQILARHSVDLVLLDLFLPDSRGYATFETFQRRAPRLPVVVLTGHTSSDLAQRALRDGAQDYLSKDELSPSLLARTIRYARERSRFQARLEESERQFRAVVEDQAELICRFRADGTLTFANAAFCRFFGRSAGQLVGTSFFALFPEDDQVELATHLAHLGPENPIGSREQRYEQDGQVGWLQWTDRALFDNLGLLRRFQSVARDTTDRKRLEEQLLQAQKMEIVGQLVGGIAHDFNNILTAIAGFGDLLMQRVEEAGLGGREMEGFEKAVQRAISLTGRLLAFSRSQPRRSEVLDLVQGIKEVHTLLRQLLDERIELVLDLPKEPLWLEIDRGMLEQVVLNLVVNARDAMPLGGPLILRARGAAIGAGDAAVMGECAVLTVEDCGIGMSEETQQRIFEPFFTTKGAGQGTGLGLATVQRIVSQFGGRIEVDSRLGEGSIFSVYLPLAEGRPEASQGTGERSPSPRMPRLVGDLLLVEDDDVVRLVLELTLGRYGFRVRSARSAEEALADLEGQPPPNLLLTDLGLPGQDGLSLALELRRRGLCSRALVISGYVAEGIRERARREGVPMLPKPFSTRQLLDRLRWLLRSSEHGGSRKDSEVPPRTPPFLGGFRQGP